MQSRNIMRGIICAMLGGICWGFSGTVGQYLFTHKDIDRQWLVMARLLAAGVILLTVSSKRHPKQLKSIWLDKRDVARLLLFAIFGLLFSQYSYLTAIYYSNSGTATVLQYLGQVFILAYVCLRAKRLPSCKEGIAVLLAMGGTFLLTTHGRLDGLVISGQALLWGLAAAVAMMLYTLLPGSLTARYGAPVCAGYGMLIGGIVLFFAIRGWRIHVAWDWGVLAGVAVIVIIGTALSYSLYIQGVSDLGGVMGSLLACTEPLSATLFAAVWLGTEFTWHDYASFAMILGMVVVLAIPGKTKKRMLH